MPLILSLTFLAPGTSTAGTEWRVVSEGVDGSQLSSDAASVHCAAEFCSATEQTNHLRPLPDGATFVIDDVEYDCRGARTRTLAERATDATGHEIARRSKPSAWFPVELGTLGFRAMRYACDGRLEYSGSVSAAPFASSDERASSPRLGGPSFSVQFLAGASGPDVERAAARMVQGHPSLGRYQPHLEQARVHGHWVYRIVVTGLTSKVEADVLCRAVAAEPSACLVRKSSDAR